MPHVSKPPSPALAASLTAAIVVLAAAAPARADEGVLEVSGFIGWHLVSDASNLGEPENPQQVPDFTGAFGLRLGKYFADRWELEGELAVMPGHATGDEDDDLYMYGYRLNLAYDLMRSQDKAARMAVVLGVGGLTTSKSDRNGDAGYDGAVDFGTEFMPHAGMAVKLLSTDTFGVRLDARAYFGEANDLVDDDVAVDFELTVGIFKNFGGAAKPAPAPAPEPTPADADGDGLVDADDKCPSEAEDKDSFQDEDGCPESDNDNDGVPDASDKAPLEPEDKDGFQDDDGAPEADNDKDGILDANDKAPDDPEDKDGFEDDDGAPDPDNDKDGVLDADDKCPDQLETKNGYQDKDGCADDLPKEVAKYTGAIKGINFQTGKATITKPSFPVLDAAVKVLNDYPELRVEIGGHTDDVGDADKNRQLSQDRAAAVRDYMISKGVPAERLRAVGYGPDKPVDPAKTAKARAKNRRVEFVLISE